MLLHVGQQGHYILIGLPNILMKLLRTCIIIKGNFFYCAGEIKNSIKVLKSDIDKRYYEFNGLCNQKLKVDVLSGYLSTDTTTGILYT